ncbi:hypothetical protein PBY51_014006 [Eleginops maclovinus]|uniref:receptor protein-tyrosine kinase n=1 Tax=Eleginops maclovinus TaxID=56733 RepID=A0AAN7WUV4_ELEMC|nr:hypothetical protein PBY51_014006 [Eleginops maclovinus]
MVAAVVLLCAVWLLCSDGVAPQHQACLPSPEVACFVPADYLNASGSVSVEMSVGQKLIISLQHFSEHPVCHWIRAADPVITVNGSDSMVLPTYSEAYSGECTLRCETSDGAGSSMNVALKVMMKRPSKPKLTIQKDGRNQNSPSLTCISEGSPELTLEWSGGEGRVVSANSRPARSSLSTTQYSEKGVMCCATNAAGQECSQLYDYDLDRDFMKDYEVSNVTVSPGEPLLLRCRAKHPSMRLKLGWEKDGRKLDIETYGCSSNVKNEICIKSDSHEGSSMYYLFFESVGLDHSGTYTCRTPHKKTKSVNIHVQAEGFLSVQLNKSKIIHAHNASRSCLQASVSYHPVLQHCSWETPDKEMIQCQMKTWVTKQRTVMLCDTLKSGHYKLHLEAGGVKETKTISVCVVDPPKLRFRIDNNYDNLTFETETLVPANYTWKSCVMSNDSSETEFNWNEIPEGSHTDSDVSCQKTIRSSLSRSLVNGHCVQFCLTNSVGSWCETQYLITDHTRMSPIAALDLDNKTILLLKVGSLLLVLALTVVVVALIYFVKKKKPKYQSQLQMIQMVGPNDNDYIYINFKEFGYDKQWEFPRENLELGPELGSGAFGMVVQATAYGIHKPGVSQQVAVKMLKEKHQTVEKEALMSELKMLTHIGQHANIVNLLGACTDSGPTYLIFQYCCYGDMLNYLKTHRELYHKSVTDAFTKDRFSSIYHNLRHKNSSSEGDKAVDNYVPMHSSITRGQEDIALLPINPGDMDSIEDPLMYEDLNDLIEDTQTLTFNDLLSFAFQVAKGMEFLSSKNCIHRDLAARNVLVTKGRLVKIGDFGLARDIDNDSNYVVRGNVRLPVKWMAPESTFQGIYTMKSDVWAYGILLWEIFSLGVTPYPGMKVDHTFYSMIERGFKMECPYYANDSVYGMMCKCWALDPCDRPTFSKLVSFVCDQLTVREEQLYHNFPDQTSSDYQNASTILDISALSQQNENKAANNYCQTHTTEESKAEVSDSEAAEEKLKTSEAD